MKTRLTMILVMLVSLLIASNSFGLTVATGKKDGGYHNKFFNTAVALTARIAGEEDIELEYYSDNGTDGSSQNVKLVNSGKADMGFTQLGATVIQESSNVTAFGPIAYELAHLVVPKKGKVGSCDDIEKKGINVGVNTMSGSNVTLDVMAKVDKDYGKLTKVDVTRGSIAMTKMNSGDIDAFFFVSVPGTKNIRRISGNAGVEFGSCWDGDFDDFKVNDKQLYTKISFSKGEAKKLGYNSKFKTFRVPAYIIVNNKVLAENEDLYDYFTDLAAAMYTQFKSQKGADAFYPSN